MYHLVPTFRKLCKIWPLAQWINNMILYLFPCDKQDIEFYLNPQVVRCGIYLLHDNEE